MQSQITVKKNVYERIHIKTHLIGFGENLTELLKHYTKNLFQLGDTIAISEKVVSVCQNNVRHISTVKAGWLAKLIVRGVKKYPKDIGFSLPEKMQLVVEGAGWARTFLAMLLGALGKLVGVRGIFWHIVGHRWGEIDGFNPDSMYPYTEYAALPPKAPKRVCQEVAGVLKIPVAIVDANNINVKVISVSNPTSLIPSLIREILLDNPFGQDNQLTPFIIIRPK